MLIHHKREWFLAVVKFVDSFQLRWISVT